MAENKNQISTQEWSERMRRGSGSASSPSSISRAPANVSGPLAQLKSNLDSLAKQRYGLAMGNVTRQYNLAERMNQATAELGANTVARRDKLYANRQDNLNRMSQLYGQYYQQFGGVLNESALRFLDKHSSISVPTLTAIMAGYEHARASRAEQELAMLDRKSKMLDAQWAVQDKIVETQQMADANKHAAAMQSLEAQSKAAQATYDAQKAYLDEQARNEMLGGGLASGGRGTGVRTLPGIGGVGAGARAGVGRVPSAVTGARSGQTVAGGATLTGRVVQTADGQTVAVDNNKNVIGTVVPTQNGSVVVNDNGQTVGSVDANGNVMPIAAEPQMGAYAQYQAAGGGGFWSNPVDNTFAALSNPYNLVSAVGAGQAINAARNFGTSARAGYLDPSKEMRFNIAKAELNQSATNIENVRNARSIFAEKYLADSRGRNQANNLMEYADYLDNREARRRAISSSGRIIPSGLATSYEEEEARRALTNLRNLPGGQSSGVFGDLRGLRAEQSSRLQAFTNAREALGGRDAINRARNAGRFMRGAGALARGAARFGGRFVPGLGWVMLGADALTYGPGLLGGAWEFARQGASNLLDYASGDYDRRVAKAIATGQPIPQRPSAWEAAGQGYEDTKRGFWAAIPGRFTEDFGMANRDDVNNFSRFFKNITGVEPDYETKRIFDKLPDVSRATILNGMLTNGNLTPQNVQAFIDDAIKTTSTPQEQRAIQQQIQAEDDERVFNRSISSTTGHNKLVEAVTRELGNHLSKLGYNFDYNDLARFGNAYTNMVSWIETRDTPGAGNKTTSATSMYQMTKDFFDNQKKYILDNFHDTLPAEQKDRLIKATSARDLDNDLDRPILQAMVLANVYNNLAVNNQHFDKQGPNIRSDQMAGDVISMMKDAYEAGQFDESGLFLDPVLGGNLARIWAVNFFRGTNPEAVRGAYENVNNAFNEAWGFNRDAQGNNLSWWDGTWNTPQRYREMLGMSGAQTQAQRAGYGFDVAPGVDVDNLNTLLLQRFSAANDAMVSATGVKGRVNSGKRSPSKQADLYRNKEKNRNPVARSGWSKHEAGVALDFNNDEWENAFNGSDQLKHDYGTFDNFLKHFGIKRGVTDKNGKRSDLVHLTMEEDDEYHNTIDHDRLMASRGKWGDQGGNYWMRGVGSRPQQTQPAWDVSPQYMVENFGYPVVEYPVTEYDPNLIFTDEYVDYDEEGYPMF